MAEMNQGTYRQFGEGRVADMSAKHLLLELEQLDHQTGQGLVGGRLRLDVLEETRQHIGVSQSVAVQ